MLAFRQEVARWYRTRYGVTLDPATEILGLIGSKEGCHHFVLARINPGDVVLMTDPGYPAYRASILMGGGIPTMCRSSRRTATFRFSKRSRRRS